MSNKLFITCPIFYVNAKPHLGHAFTLCLADAWAHYAQLRGNPALLPFASTRPSKSFKLFKKQVPSSILLTSGTDEHGTKVAQAAKLYRKSPKAYVDEISPLFKMLCQRNSVALSDFVRTTDERHKKAVEAFWCSKSSIRLSYDNIFYCMLLSFLLFRSKSRLDASGHIYESSYSGWYSVSDETFYSDWEIATPTQRTSGQGRSFPDRNVTRVAIETGSPVEWIEERTYMFRVTAFKRQLHEWLDSGAFLEQSEAQQAWKAKAHEMVDTAQDISLSRPRSRLDWGIPVPKDPQQVTYVWLDALINYLTVAGFPWPKVKPSSRMWPPDFQFVGKDILRVTSTKLNPNQYVVRIDRAEAGALFEQSKEDAELLEKLDTLAARFDECWWDQAQPHLAIEQILQVIRLTNALIERHKPWQKDPLIESEHVIALAAESLRLAGLLLSPVVPNLAGRLLRRLGCGQTGEDPSEDHSPHDNLFWSLGPDTGPLLRRLP
ncbi:Methionine tRNA synthetase [Fasciola hepatica]|uniref:Methionine--tRNA ligase, mitochondrial n=1 Tax=Fasciola hepatica TaxID=6192 RepID=A0A4E0QZA2_FASHE|nr:Methionine tRNA synthetase [Fasciola hepatica]